jgi:hypothetical protein
MNNLKKEIKLYIDEDDHIDERIHLFSSKEIIQAIEIGVESIIRGRNFAVNMSQQEIYNKIKDESMEEIKKLEMEMVVQREVHKKMEEKIESIYKEKEEQIKNKNEKLEDIIKGLKEEVKVYEMESSKMIQEEILKEREKLNIILQEKENQVNKLSETFNNVIKMTNKSNSHKGSDGEKTFKYYAETFKDFKGYDIVDKHTQGGEGDFHMHFDEFDILVDAKNYKKGVPSRERDKIKGDLLKNEHINFAWLVSLNTKIDKFDKSPIMYEWVSTTKCICYINDLSHYEDPSNILRVAWFTCKELFKFITIDEEVDVSELTELRESKFRINDKIKNVRKTIRELNTTIGVFKKQVDNVDYELRDLLDVETSIMVESNFTILNNWWNENIEKTEEDVSMVSTDIWFKFRQDNKDCIKEFDITPEKFRDFIKTKLPMTSYSLRNKNSSSAIDIKGIVWKKVDEIKPEMVIVEENKEIKKKKVIKREPPKISNEDFL